MNFVRPFGLILIASMIWFIIASIGVVPVYMLPNPVDVLQTILTQHDLLLANALVTLGEILLGLLLGTLFGALAAVGVAASGNLQSWFMPVLVLSQAIPVFALAPLLVLWFGFGLASKIIMTTLIIFFPVTSSLVDGLRRTDAGWLDLAATMNARSRNILRFIRMPAALPALASGLRIATAVAPIGAIIGEWAGASSGLGYVMINANARIEPALMFAALLILCVISLGLYSIVDRALRAVLPWAPL